jgi:hypothetical protein
MKKRDREYPQIFADVGPNDETGEMSIRAAQPFGLKDNSKIAKRPGTKSSTSLSQDRRRGNPRDAGEI